MSKKNKIKPDVVMKEFWRVNERLQTFLMAFCFREKQ